MLITISRITGKQQSEQLENLKQEYVITVHSMHTHKNENKGAD